VEAAKRVRRVDPSLKVQCAGTGDCAEFGLDSGDAATKISELDCNQCFKKIDKNGNKIDTTRR